MDFFQVVRDNLSSYWPTVRFMKCSSIDSALIEQANNAVEALFQFIFIIIDKCAEISYWLIGKWLDCEARVLQETKCNTNIDALRFVIIL